MADQFCVRKLDELTQLVRLQEGFMLTFCILNLVSSVVAILGNLLVICALWKSSSIPATVNKLFLSLAFSDLAVGILPQLIFGVIIAVMLKMESTGNDNFSSFCPTIVTVCYFFFFLFCSASGLCITAVAVDRLLAILLHLRYQEIVTSKRVNFTLTSLWLSRGVAASLFILLPTSNNLIAGIIEFIGHLLTTVAYARIYKALRYHQNQIHSQLQMQNGQALDLLRQRKSALNALFVYLVFVVCYMPLFFSVTFLLFDSMRTSFLLFDHIAVFLIFLNSSLNPLVYCWRYREVREFVKRIVKRVFCMDDDEA